MATSLQKSGKEVLSWSAKFTQIAYISSGEKIVKIGTVDPEIIGLKLKKKKKLRIVN